MNKIIQKFSCHACQYCGSEQKLVETLIDDEFFWNESEKRYEPNKFTNNFEHTGNDRCSLCEADWSGV
ncbi:hypothetical protein KC872_02390 [Candidatus Kaiserbacteria bacterium]|nr:hypothetical protein [Candidatus Kaiserbacteria bacterium]